MALLRRSLVVLMGLLLLLLLLTAVLRLVRPGALPQMALAGIEIGGMDEEGLEGVIADLESARRQERITVVRSEDVGNNSFVVATGAELGYSLDRRATLRRVMERGRQNNPAAAFADHMRAFFGTIEVEPVARIDADVLDPWAQDASKKLATAPREGGLRFDGAEFTRIEPAPGATIDRDHLARALRRALADESRNTIEVRTRPAAPATTGEDVDELEAAAVVAVSAPIELRRAGNSLSLQPDEIGGVLGVRMLDDGDDVSLELFVRPKRLVNTLGDRIEPLETPPRDASFRLAGGKVEVVPSRPGIRFAPKRAARQVATLAASEEKRSGRLKGIRDPAGFSTKDAKSLNITEEVGTFTTSHSCCEPRVTNIHRIADIVDGAVLRPGESFSLNGYVGPRTEENGFVGAPSIRDGEFVDEIGGGISQFATTFFNAIFFGGYDFLEYKAHSYYIDRYPMGREATISTPSPDLSFLNDSKAGIYIATSYTDTSITVTLYGSQNFEVEAIMGDPYNVKSPPTTYRRNKDLAPGEERVISSGRNGFDVNVKRVFKYGGGRRETEDFFTRYLPEPRIVERGPKKKGKQKN